MLPEKFTFDLSNIINSLSDDKFFEVISNINRYTKTNYSLKETHEEFSKLISSFASSEISFITKTHISAGRPFVFIIEGIEFKSGAAKEYRSKIEQIIKEA
jgi:chromatin remodeling complex protein RSC6